jgi:hypothetical protein
VSELRPAPIGGPSDAGARGVRVLPPGRLFTGPLLRWLLAVRVEPSALLQRLSRGILSSPDLPLFKRLAGAIYLIVAT